MDSIAQTPVDILDRLMFNLSIVGCRVPNVPGYAYERFTTEKQKEVLRALKSDDIKEIRQDVLGYMLTANEGMDHRDRSGSAYVFNSEKTDREIKKLWNEQRDKLVKNKQKQKQKQT